MERQLKFLITGDNEVYDISITEKIGQLNLDNTEEDKELSKELVGDNFNYSLFYGLTSGLSDEYTEVHPNMVLTQKGAYTVVIGYKDEVPKNMAGKKLCFLYNGKLIHEYAEKMNLKTPVLEAIPLAPYYEDIGDKNKLSKFFYKIDLQKLDLRQLFLFKAVILGNFAVVETQNEISCISLKGKSRTQDLTGFKLYGKVSNKPLLVTTQGGKMFLFELSDKLTLKNIIKE